MDYDDKNTFILFYEADKKTEKSPDMTGKFTDSNGKEWRIAAWERTSKNGKNFLSGKVDEFKPRESTTAPSWEAQRQKFAKKDEVVEDVPTQAEVDDDILRSIPF